MELAQYVKSTWFCRKWTCCEGVYRLKMYFSSTCNLYSKYSSVWCGFNHVRSVLPSVFELGAYCKQVQCVIVQ